MRNIVWTCLVAAGLAFPGIALAAPVSIDGVLGAEWTGATVKSVLYNAAAPIGNFGAPTNENHAVAYDIYTRADATYFYIGLETATNYAGGLDFANLYFDTSPGTGSDVAFEVINTRAFDPNVGMYFNYTAGTDDIHYSLTAGSASTPSVIEFAVPFTFFLSDPLGIGFPVATTAVQLRLSQTFGYSVAGGASYGADRLGTVAVPEPTSMALAAVGLVGLAYVARRRRLTAR